MLITLDSGKSSANVFGRAQYLSLLINESGIRNVLKKNPVIDLHDLYLLLYIYWVLDDRTYDDERQPAPGAAELLTVVFF